MIPGNYYRVKSKHKRSTDSYIDVICLCKEFMKSSNTDLAAYNVANVQVNQELEKTQVWNAHKLHKNYQIGAQRMHWYYIDQVDENEYPELFL